MCFDALAGVRDPELRRKLTPDYEVGCKRLVFSGDYYEAVQHPNVDVVVDPIDHIEPRGIVTKDGTLHELDVLAFATGFDAHAYLRPMQLTGEDGITLDQVWADLPVSYRSMAIPHMPNFLMLNGPYSPGGTASVVGIVEAQADYVMQLIERIAAGGVAIAPKVAGQPRLARQRAGQGQRFGLGDRRLPELVSRQDRHSDARSQHAFGTGSAAGRSGLGRV